MRPCYHCEFFDFSAGSPGYSEMTPGSDASATCYKNHWVYDTIDGFATNFRKNATHLTIREALDTGLTCPDFQEVSK